MSEHKIQVNRQTCQQCGSIEVRNILVRKSGNPTVVYVRCANCQELVASYELSGYYHHGKGLESFLRGQGVSGGDSGRQWLAEFKQVQQESLEGFQQAVQQLEEANKEV